MTRMQYYLDNPRGFSNEFAVYAVSATEAPALIAALEWATERARANGHNAAYWRRLTRREADRLALGYGRDTRPIAVDVARERAGLLVEAHRNWQRDTWSDMDSEDPRA